MTDAELIRAVAVDVMGWQLCAPGKCWHIDVSHGAHVASRNWNPLTDANAMMQVVERMRELGCAVVITSHAIGGWCAEFNKTVPEENMVYEGNLGRAVCEAALKAVRAKQ